MDDTFYFLFPQCIFLFIFRGCVLTLKKIRKLQRGWKSGSAARAAPGQQGARGARAGPLTPRGLTGPRTPWAAGRARRCGRPNSLSCRPEARAARAAVLQVRPRRKARPDGAGCERASSALRTARTDPRRGATAPRCSAVRRGRGPDVRRAGGSLPWAGSGGGDTRPPRVYSKKWRLEAGQGAGPARWPSERWEVEGGMCLPHLPQDGSDTKPEGMTIRVFFAHGLVTMYLITSTTFHKEY